MTRSIFVFAMALFAGLSAGCPGAFERLPPPKTFVSGYVTLDGSAMSHPRGEISFHTGGEAPVTFPIVDGKFFGEAHVGECRVEINAWEQGEPIMMNGSPFGDPVDISVIDEEFNVNSQLRANIPEQGVSDLMFKVHTRGKQD